nr:S8 family serine peptidase [Thermoleptolyngbya sp. PKUAC-SCTB121]
MTGFVPPDRPSSGLSPRGGADFQAEGNPVDAMPPASGVLAEQEGMILQRGGEELRLQKLGDRFTFRPTADAPAEITLEDWVQQLDVESLRPVPGVDLIEVKTAAGQADAGIDRARAHRYVAFASHVYQLAQNPQTRVYLTDELTVQFANSVTTEAMGAIALELGLKPAQPVVGIPQTYVFEVTPQARANPIKLANQLMRRPDVLLAEPNIVIRAQQLYRPQEPEYPRQWYLQTQGSSQIAPTAHISVEPAWDVTRGSRAVVVAVTDDGFDLNHPDFQGPGKIVQPRDFKLQTNLPLPEASHENHGTACAGVAIAEENQFGIVGVAPGCSLMPLRTTGFLDDQAIESLFDWALQKGAAVVSCSWGASAAYFPLSLRQRAAINRAATQGRGGKGCVVVFAAGNANRPISGTVNEQGWVNNVLRGNTQWLNGFAVHPDVIAVAASTSLDKKAAYSNWGDAISVTAPSNNAPPGMWLPQTGYTYTGPQIRAALPGVGVFTTDRLGAAGYDPGSFTNTFGGTSSACPVVAGVAALVLSVNPDLTAREVKQILQETADKIVDPDPDPQLGLRFGTYDASGHSKWFGYGKVNAARAVEAARRRLSAAIAPSEWQSLSNTTPVAIPDDTPRGATSILQVQGDSRGERADRPLRDLRITVDVEHSYLGDLEIMLLPPQGDPILLQSRTLGRRTRLQTTYTLQTTPLLRTVLNRSARGVWQLRLVDCAPQHVGRLLSWQLNLGF